MLDIKFIRENKDLVMSSATKKHISVDIEQLLKLDDERIRLQQEIESRRAEQNKASDAIAQAEGDDRQKMIDQMTELKSQIQKFEEELKPVQEQWQQIMYQVPNVCDESVPEGESDEDNVEIKVWGEKTQFAFQPKDHVELMLALGMVDFERGSKVHGFRGYFLKNDGAMLTFAIWNYAMQFFSNKGFSPMITPTIAREGNFVGTGFLPGEEDDLYKTQDGDYLIGTSEVPIMGYHSDEVIDVAQFPLKYLGFSPCFRREAGSHGRDVKGLIRVHEFHKIEQVVLCEADHAESVKHHEQINRNTEEFIESLGIPYHTVVNCGGDLGQGQVKKYDIELWVPMEETYREISSASYFHDFQTRRSNIRYKDAEGKMRFAHSLNCTAIPTPRILVSLVENFQNADGSITIPQVLVPYLGKDKIG